MSSFKAGMIAKARPQDAQRKRYAVVITQLGQHIALPTALSSNGMLRTRIYVPTGASGTNRFIFSSSAANGNNQAHSMYYSNGNLIVRYGYGQNFTLGNPYISRWLDLELSNELMIDGVLVKEFTKDTFSAPTLGANLFSERGSTPAHVGVKMEAYQAWDYGSPLYDLVGVPEGSTEFYSSPAQENGFWCRILQQYFYSAANGPFGIEEVA